MDNELVTIGLADFMQTMGFDVLVETTEEIRNRPFSRDFFLFVMLDYSQSTYYMFFVSRSERTLAPYSQDDFDAYNSNLTVETYY